MSEKELEMSSTSQDVKHIFSKEELEMLPPLAFPYRIGSRMIIYVTDEDRDGMNSQFFHPSDNHFST